MSSAGVHEGEGPLHTRGQMQKITSGRAASKEDIDRIMTLDSDLLSGEGKAFPISENIKDRLAIVDDNGSLVLLINENYRNQSQGIVRELYAIRNRYKRETRDFRKILYVKLGVLKRLYSSGQMLSAGRTDQTTAIFRQHWLDLCTAAAKQGASDIHLQTKNGFTNISLRVHGTLKSYKEFPNDWGRQMVACIFTMTDGSDAVYKATSFQSGRISNPTYLPHTVQSVRTQFNPTSDPVSATGGVYMVCRLLYAGDRIQGSLADLGYTAEQISQFERIKNKPYGINIIAGVTGSGKSTTLVKALTELKIERPGDNILTIEDPAEYVIEGARQFSIVSASNDPKERNKAFTEAISAALRSDPDKIMIGEIRDEASASLSVEACQTGHQVWASLHASTAISILARLEDIGVENYKLADPGTITGLIGQRLVPTLCPHCRIPWDKAEKDGTLAENGYRKPMRDSVRRVCDGFMDKVHVKNKEGCSHCIGGIAGRQIIAEIVTPDNKFMDFIRNHDTVGATEYWLDNLNGMTMMEHAAQQVIRGEVDPMTASEIGGSFEDFRLDRREKVLVTLNRNAKEWLEENR